MKQSCLLTLLILALACGVAEGAAATSNWPQFRGANASGSADEARPPVNIGPKEGVLWSADVPWSPSSPCVWRGQIFLTTYDEGQLETRCYDARTGRLRWSRGVKPDSIEDFHHTDGSPAASTPATDGRRVVSYFGSAGVFCYNLKGKELWRYSLPVALSIGQYGSGASPIIVGDRVVVNRDQFRYSSLLALDLKTGAKVWETPRPDSPGSFGTPVVWRDQGVDEIVLGARGRLRGYDLQSGAERWVVEGITGLSCTTPVVADGMLYYAAFSNATPDSGMPSWEEFAKTFGKNVNDAITFDEIPADRRDYLRGLDVNRDGKLTKEDFDMRSAAIAHCENLLVAVKPGGTGNITDTHVAWKFRKGLPYVPSPLEYGGRIYMVKDGGLVTSLDARTGQPFYVQERIGAAGNYYASPVAADGRIYLASLEGTVTVVKAGGEKPEVLHQADFGDRILATPALVGERLYLRTAGKLWAFGR